MSLPEMIFLVAVTVILPISVLSLLFSYQKARLKAKGSSGSKELTTSELQELIDTAVAEATVELTLKVEELERGLRLLSPGSSDALDETQPASKSLGSVTRE